jgi:hypothetical protein
MRKLWAVLAILILLLALLLSTSGWFLVVNNPQHADVIVALAGETDRRPSRALELLRAGYAPKLAVGCSGGFQDLRSANDQHRPGLRQRSG